jgi:hypothetical protein
LLFDQQYIPSNGIDRIDRQPKRLALCSQLEPAIKPKPQVAAE